MTALSDIRAAIAQRQRDRKLVPLIGRYKTMVVEIGDSARRGVMAETSDSRLPTEIDGVPVIRTTAFKGWEVSER